MQTTALHAAQQFLVGAATTTTTTDQDIHDYYTGAQQPANPL